MLGGGLWHTGPWSSSPMALISRQAVKEAPTRPEVRWLALRPPHLSQLLLWFLGIHSASGSRRPS